jgi:hypothetical protein
MLYIYIYLDYVLLNKPRMNKHILFERVTELVKLRKA